MFVKPHRLSKGNSQYSSISQPSTVRHSPGASPVVESPEVSAVVLPSVVVVVVSVVPVVSVVIDDPPVAYVVPEVSMGSDDVPPDELVVDSVSLVEVGLEVSEWVVSAVVGSDITVVDELVVDSEPELVEVLGSVSALDVLVVGPILADPSSKPGFSRRQATTSKRIIVERART